MMLFVKMDVDLYRNSVNENIHNRRQCYDIQLSEKHLNANKSFLKKEKKILNLLMFRKKKINKFSNGGGGGGGARWYCQTFK